MESKNRRRRQSGDSCGCLKPLIRIWGILTAIVVCGVGIDIAVHGHTAGFFILSASIIIFFLELKWVFTIFIKLCSNDNTSKCAKYWSVCRYLGGWRLSPPYIAFGCELILWPHHLWLSYVAGIQLIFLAVLRLFTIIRFNGNVRDEELLSQYDDSFDKCDILTEVIDDSLPEVVHSLDEEEPLEEI